jgi:hypothetical protein
MAFIRRCYLCSLRTRNTPGPGASTRPAPDVSDQALPANSRVGHHITCHSGALASL